MFIPGMILILLVADGIWLTINNKTHTTLIESIQKTPLQVRYAPAILVYVLILAAVYFFAIENSTSVTNAALRGALLGFCVYGVYDLTNYATLTKYTLQMTVTDMTWGTVLCALVAGVGFYLKNI